MNFGWEVQRAIYIALSNDPQLADMVVGVYDAPPQDPKYPYIVIGDDTLVDWDTDTSYGAEVTITIHVWSAYHGAKEAKEILGRIAGILHTKELSLRDTHLVLLRREFEQVLVDVDGTTRHGVCRYRAVVTEQEG